MPSYHYERMRVGGNSTVVISLVLCVSGQDVSQVLFDEGNQND